MAAALPNEFATYTRQLFGDEMYGRFLHSFEEDPPVSIRINPFKRCPPPAGERVAWCEDAFYLPRREEFTLNPLFHAGCFYVQEAAGMFLDRVLRQYVKEPVQMLDLCAAPGGKATLARAVLPEGSVLYCNETEPGRAQILVENIQKQGHRDVVVTNNYAKDYQLSGLMFDVILADVPCSGEGMFRKDRAAIDFWSVKNVVRCAELQRSIINDISKCLKKGGLFVYSTCTLNTRENEENVRFAAEELEGEVLSVQVEDDWHITPSLLNGFTENVYRFIPGVSRSEGQFMAIVRKGNGNATFRGKQSSRLRILYDGRNITPGKNVPSCAEALLSAPSGIYPRKELTREAALAYLRREPLHFGDDVPKGFVVVCYEGHALGFVKNIGTRANNLYPREWKIRYK